LNNNNKEQGYALVTVLLIVTIFMVVSLSFMGQAFSSVKQNTVVEKVSQSVAVAEMGVAYYKVALQDIYETEQPGVYTYLAQEYKKDSTINYKLLAVEEFYNRIPPAFGVGSIPYTKPVDFKKINDPVYPIESNSSSYFVLKDFNAVKGTDSIDFHYKVEGYDNGEKTELNAEMTISFQSLSAGEPTFNFVKKPEPPNCTDLTKLNETGCNQILVGSETFPSNSPNNLSNKTIYSTGTLTVNNNINTITDVHIHAHTLNIGNNLKNADGFATGSTIETIGDVTIGNNFTADWTNLYIGGSITVDGQFNLRTGPGKNEKALIRGNVTVTNHMTIGTDYTMCVKGNIEAATLTVSGSLYARENSITLTQNNATINGPVKWVEKLKPEEMAAFQNACGTTFENSTIIWDDNIETEIDNVNYN
jgi:hypothetical protein